MREDRAAWIIVVCFPLLYGFVSTFNCNNSTPPSMFEELEKELKDRKSYPPVKNFSAEMVISLDITLVGILGVREKEQTLITYIWQVLKWKIEGLSWNETECGTNRVSVLREKLWYPDVHITEFMDEDKSPITPYVYLNSTGHVYDDKPLRVVSTCELKIYTFPFDIQNCSLTFASYLHFDNDIRLIPATTAQEILEESLNVAQTNGEWELLNIQVVPGILGITDGNYSQITYNIILRRRPILYVVNLIVPSCFLVTLDLFSFLLPPHSVDRSAFEMTLILGYTVFLLLMNDLLPVTGNEAPLLNVFFCLSFALMVANLLATVFITNLHFHSSHYKAVPRWLSVLMLQYLASAVGLPPKKANRVTVSLPEQTQAAISTSIISPRDLLRLSGDLDPEKLPADETLEELRKLSRDLLAIRLQIDSYIEGNNVSQDWKMIANVLDRLLFALYLVFLFVSFTVMSVTAYSSRYGT